ncbi:hypothetical protein [Streptomyces rhizosphaerihabitans]|uniref:hypothetical protein n=1 Tax=Streptomyces rhizosphaerihabitans TaxID=1266770 RepID=UPI0021C1EB99|nr:hypothetical protein [Streptomyces rhizosphaerihabitans]MCT9011623.1 hypothetical protein [Streptomyces rhizosphaerihabitans]
MSATEDITESKLLLAEYDRIKEEQKARIGFRDNLLYVTLASVTGVIAISLQGRNTDLLLALPLVCIVLGWTYLVNDEKISAIGRYIRTELGPRLTVLSAAGTPIFSWEVYHRSDRRRVPRKIMQALVDITAYIAVPAIGLAAFWLHNSAGPLLILVSVAEGAALAGMAAQFLLYAER